MDLSKLGIHDILNMLFQKVSEMTHMADISKIDWGNITGAIITTVAIIFTSAFVLWLLKAIGLYVMAKNKGDKYAFIAFVPYGCLYTMGKIVGKTKLFGIEIEYSEYLLPLLALAMYFPMTSWLATILFMFFYFGILYRIYQLYIPNAAIILLILSIIFPILPPFFIFFLRNKDTQATKK